MVYPRYNIGNSTINMERWDIWKVPWNISQVPLHLRQSWFEELLRLRRRRARFLWLDTPLAKLFTPQDFGPKVAARRLWCGSFDGLKIGQKSVNKALEYHEKIRRVSLEYHLDIRRVSLECQESVIRILSEYH